MRYEKIELKNEFPFLGEGGRNPVLELYLPYNMTEMKRENQKRPCMIVCPGGGYWICSQREAEPIALHFLPEGFNVFILTYSVPKQTFPAQIREVAAVLELIYKNAVEWNCDTEKIAIIGFSAGAHNCAAFLAGLGGLAETLGCPAESLRPAAALLCYGVYEMEKPADPAGMDGALYLTLLGERDPAPERLREISPLHGVTADFPPCFLWATSADEMVPVRQTLRMAAALSEKGVPIETHIFEKGGHALSTASPLSASRKRDVDPDAGKWVSLAEAFLRRHVPLPL